MNWFKNQNKLSAGGNSNVVVQESGVKQKDPDEPGSPSAENILPVDPPLKSEMGPDQRTSGDRQTSSGAAEQNRVMAAAPSPLDELLEERLRHAELERQLAEKPIFEIGEVVLLKGTFWRVKAITSGRLYLDHVER